MRPVPSRVGLQSRAEQLLIAIYKKETPTFGRVSTNVFADFLSTQYGYIVIVDFTSLKIPGTLLSEKIHETFDEICRLTYHAEFLSTIALLVQTS